MVDDNVAILAGNVILWFKCAHYRSVDMNSEKRLYFVANSFIVMFSH